MKFTLKFSPDSLGDQWVNIGPGQRMHLETDESQATVFDVSFAAIAHMLIPGIYEYGGGQIIGRETVREPLVASPAAMEYLKTHAEGHGAYHSEYVGRLLDGFMAEQVERVNKQIKEG